MTSSSAQPSERSNDNGFGHKDTRADQYLATLTLYGRVGLTNKLGSVGFGYN